MKRPYKVEVSETILYTLTVEAENHLEAAELYHLDPVSYAHTKVIGDATGDRDIVDLYVDEPALIGATVHMGRVKDGEQCWLVWLQYDNGDHDHISTLSCESEAFKKARALSVGHYGDNLKVIHHLSPVQRHWRYGDIQEVDTEVNMPAWAVTYIHYGDGSGLSDDEIKLVDDWLQLQTDRFASLTFVQTNENDQPEFCNNPAFGLPTDCYDYQIFAHYRYDHVICADPAGWSDKNTIVTVFNDDGTHTAEFGAHAK